MEKEIRRVGGRGMENIGAKVRVPTAFFKNCLYFQVRPQTGGVRGKRIEVREGGRGSQVGEQPEQGANLQAPWGVFGGKGRLLWLEQKRQGGKMGNRGQANYVESCGPLYRFWL